MTFILRMVVRETRAAWRRLLFFFLCVALGVGAIAAMRSVIQSVRGALAREARAMSGADVIVQSGRPFEPGVREAVDEAVRRIGTAAVSGVTETATMVRPADPAAAAAARMVELQAVDARYPIYGRIVLEDGVEYTYALLRNRGVLVRPELLAQLDLAPGDRLMIGNASFEIRGVLAREPGRRLGLFSLGPRVIIDAADLPATGLLTFGSRARYRLLLRVPDAAIQPVVTDLRDRFRNSFISVRSYRDQEERVGNELEDAENYLSLVGYVIVVLGGIGVWSVTRVFIQQKLRSIAVLKCLGGTAGRILAVYMVQVLLLGLFGSGLGLLLAFVAIQFVPPSAFANFGEVSYGLTWSASLQALGIGLLVSLLFALVPLLEIRRVRPLLLLREDNPPPVAGAREAFGRLRDRILAVDWLRVGVGAGVVAALAALASWQAASWRVGLIVSLGFVAVSLVLLLASALLVRAVRPLSRIRWFPLRHAILGFGRPGHQTRVIVMAVGLGCFFILGVRLLEHNLTRQFAFDLRPDSPDMFLIDIQQDQRDGIAAFLQQVGSDPAPRLLPVLRARVAGVQGRDVTLDSVEAVRERGSISREFVVTWRDHLAANERIVEGQFWTGPTDGDAEVSIERRLRDRAGLRLGDRIRFDVLGRLVDARVTSVREVDWDDARAGGFMFVFRPGTLEKAPHGYIAILRAPADPVARARMQRDLVAAWPNVSAIDVREVVQTVQAVLRNVTLAISVVGGVALFCGLLILAGAVAMTKFQRLQEVALLKTLGASSRVVGALLLIEYGVLGLLAGTIGAIGALVLSYVFTRQVLDIPWDPAPGTAFAGILLTGLVVAAVGLLASLDVLRRKPLAVLRAG
ncbi:MAG TPA: FtsX-like permease family protein [Vicinamibacterales bacterium]